MAITNTVYFHKTFGTLEVDIYFEACKNVDEEILTVFGI